MKNIYITSIPLQGKNELEKVVYVPQDNINCDAQVHTSFPIIPVIMATQDDEVENKIVVVRMKNSDTDHNLELFKKELQDIGVDASCLVCVELEESSSLATGTNMFLDVLKVVEDDADVYACVTFGTKIISMVISYALSSIKNIYKNTFVKGVCYGQIDRKDGVIVGSRIWDVSGILRINEISTTVAALKFSDPLAVMSGLLKDGE